MLLDITRLIGRAHRAGPSGIDRLDLAYAQHFLVDGEPGREAFAVINLFGRLFGVHPGSARRFILAVAARWRGDAPDISLARLYAMLLGGHWMAGWQLRRRLRGFARPPVYLVLSHYRLEDAASLARIRRYFGASVVTFLHDLIPIDYPQFVEPSTTRQHEHIVSNVSRYSDAVLVNSQFTATRFHQYQGRAPGPRVGSAHPAVHVAWTGVRLYPAPPRGPGTPTRDATPYFVIIGTIEPKKNHILLLNVWAGLATMQAQPPRLLVIGTRGWRNEREVAMLERAAREHGLVEEHNHVSDAAIGALLADACAVLVPSIVEGYGLPLAEALGCGVPVICSDIPPFREVGGDVPEFLDPLDERAWQDMLVAYAAPGSARRAAQLERLRHWSMPTWEAHFGVVRRALDGVSPRGTPS